MSNVMKLMKQAATMQKEMEQLQAQLAARTYDFTSGGGMVAATARGDGTLLKIKIDPKVIDPRDPAMLEDLVLAAAEGALREARETMNREMAKITSGLRIPGMPGMGM